MRRAVDTPTVPDYPLYRHGCGTVYNKLKWRKCPQCVADDAGVYAMRCPECREHFYNRDPLADCPECGAPGAVAYTPETTMEDGPET